MALKVKIIKDIPFNGVGNLEISKTQVIVVGNTNIYDAQVNADKVEVTKLTAENKAIHAHIEADKTAVAADKVLVQTNTDKVQALTNENNTIHAHIEADKTAITTMRNEVESDRANVQTNTNTVNTLTTEVRTAHTHIHDDKTVVAADKALVQSNKNAVQTMHDEVERDRSQVATNTATVNTKHADVVSKHNAVTTMHREVEADKNTVVDAKAVVLNSEENIIDIHAHIEADKSNVQSNTNTVNVKHSDVVTKHSQVTTMNTNVNTKHADVVSKHSDTVSKHADVVKRQGEITTTHNHIHADKSEVSVMKTAVEASESVAVAKANIATTKANEAATSAAKSLTEANRAKSMADKINIIGGSVTGNLTVSGTIFEGGKPLNQQYAKITYVDSEIAELKGGVGGAYDTLKEIQAAIESNDGEIGNLNTAIASKVSKAGDTMTGKLNVPNIGLTGGVELMTFDGGEARGRVFEVKNPNNSNYFFYADKTGFIVNSDIKERGIRVYSPSNETTPSKIGAYTKAETDAKDNLRRLITDSYNKAEVDSRVNTKVSKAGDTMTGTLNITKGAEGVYLKAPSGQASYFISSVGGINNWFVGKGGASDNVSLQSYAHSRNVSINSDGVYIGGSGQEGKIYTTGNKPTAADVGALAVGAKAADANLLDGINSDGFTRMKSHYLNFGGTSGNWTTAQFVEWIKTQGALAANSWVARGSWAYASNKTITDTNCGNIHLSGCVVEVIGSTSAYTIRITTPTTTSGGTANAEFIYINNGSDYAPKWRRDYNTDYKPTAADVGLSNVPNTAHTHAATANTVAVRDSAADISARLLRTNYQNQTDISGAIAFRVNNTTDNYTRYCSSPAAVRNWMGAVNKAGDIMTGALNINGITAGNGVPTIDQTKVDGYGLIGNRGAVYVTNGSVDANAAVNIGVGGAHAAGTKLSITKTTVNAIADLCEKGQRVYSPNNKPTAAALGMYGVNADILIDKVAPRLWLRGDINSTDSGKIYITEDTTHGGWMGYDGASNVMKYGYRANSADGTVFEHNYNSPDVRFMGSISMGTTTVRKTSGGDLEFLI